MLFLFLGDFHPIREVFDFHIQPEYFFNISYCLCTHDCLLIQLTYVDIDHSEKSEHSERILYTNDDGGSVGIHYCS